MNVFVGTPRQSEAAHVLSVIMNVLTISFSYTNTISVTPSAAVARRHPVYALSRPEPPPGLHNRIVATIHAEVARERQRRRIRRYTGLAIAALLSLIAIAHTSMR